MVEMAYGSCPRAVGMRARTQGQLLAEKDLKRYVSLGLKSFPFQLVDASIQQKHFSSLMLTK